jgi:hypothetical protein
MSNIGGITRDIDDALARHRVTNIHSKCAHSQPHPSSLHTAEMLCKVLLAVLLLSPFTSGESDVPLDLGPPVPGYISSGATSDGNRLGLSAVMPKVSVLIVVRQSINRRMSLLESAL